jgi:hypothetical protein
MNANLLKIAMALIPELARFAEQRLAIGAKFSANAGLAVDVAAVFSEIV